ncbi:MAG: sulfotransferase family 2 domain-containing protein [Pseudomonadota bacterium]
MILNHQHRFIFIHVPKAAGTTVTRALSPLTTFRDIELGGTKYGEALQGLFASRFDLRKHSTGSALQAKCPGHIWQRFFVFAFVRNPYARAYSVFRFLQRWKEGPHYDMANGLDLSGFLASDDVLSGEIEIARPQTHWLTRDGAALKGIDFIGRVENFAEDFGFVLSTIHRRPTRWQEDRHDNASAGPEEWRSHMTQEVRQQIEALYAPDFETWGYEREAEATPAVASAA